MHSRPPSTAAARPSAPPSQQRPKAKPVPKKLPNLDYLSFGNEPEPQAAPTSRTAQPIKTEPGPTDWEKLLGSLDNGETNIYDACYGGPPVDALLDTPSLGLHNNHSTPAITDGSLVWSADLWALCQTDTNASSSSGLTPPSAGHPAPASILSFTTDDGLSSTEDFTADWTSGSASSTQSETYRGIVLPHGDDTAFSSTWESGLNL